MKQTLSIYLHIPFCRHRCAYCDFNTYTGLGDLQETYADALAEEARLVGAGAPERMQVGTLFFGGGTPSLMSPAALSRILRAVRAHFDLLLDAEITMEANPDSVDEAYLQQVRALGVNRLSFGMQSANPGELALLERNHDLNTVVAAVAAARRAGFDNLSLDLIYGLPHQSLAAWERSLQAALSLSPEHLSLYCLTIEPGTPMQRWLQNGQIPLPDPDLAADQYALACATLEDGWRHYEISNWARPGRACRHNLTYWHNESYLGLGAGAHGHAGGYRYSVVRQPRTYLHRIEGGQRHRFPLSPAVADAARITPAEAMADAMITRLRLLDEGVALDYFRAQFGQTVRERYGATVDQLLEWDLLQERDNRLLLTERGWFLSNQIFYRFLRDD
ncbi:MAG: radical SAM family heme chaperone HemW [Candidatus Promineifilaceae bacterium]|nr:radical SAM family heme chaperone HemW [Candidatus Promineifilaceae bacterium]